MPLSARQGTILAAIRKLTAEEGHPPTLREIADRVGLSSDSAVRHNIEGLVQAGLVTRQGGVARSVRLTAQAAPTAPVDSADLVRAAEAAEQRASEAERKLATTRAEIGRSRERAKRWKAETQAARAVHQPVPEHPRALLDVTDPDRECVECGGDVDRDADRHYFDLESESWRCTAHGGLSPMVCGHCRDVRGRPVPFPCPTIRAMDQARS
jgi:DNA-binding IscR family transcriptional regulator